MTPARPTEPHPGAPQPCPFCGRVIQVTRLPEGDLVVLDLATPVYFVGTVRDGEFALATRLWSGYAAHDCPGKILARRRTPCRAGERRRAKA